MWEEERIRLTDAHINVDIHTNTHTYEIFSVVYRSIAWYNAFISDFASIARVGELDRSDRCVARHVECQRQRSMVSLTRYDHRPAADDGCAPMDSISQSEFVAI